MILIKITGVICGMGLMGAGFSFIIGETGKKHTLGSIFAVAGFLIFCLSMLLILVPDFFRSG